MNPPPNLVCIGNTHTTAVALAQRCGVDPRRHALSAANLHQLTERLGEARDFPVVTTGVIPIEALAALKNRGARFLNEPETDHKPTGIPPLAWRTWLGQSYTHLPDHWEKAA